MKRKWKSWNTVGTKLIKHSNCSSSDISHKKSLFAAVKGFLNSLI